VPNLLVWWRETFSKRITNYFRTNVEPLIHEWIFSISTSMGDLNIQ
jgi:hypothetical protein